MSSAAENHRSCVKYVCFTQYPNHANQNTPLGTTMTNARIERSFCITRDNMTKGRNQ
jgi:hypothetical protein